MTRQLIVPISNFSLSRRFFILQLKKKIFHVSSISFLCVQLICKCFSKCTPTVFLPIQPIKFHSLIVSQETSIASEMDSQEQKGNKRATNPPFACLKMHFCRHLLAKNQLCVLILREDRLNTVLQERMLIYLYKFPFSQRRKRPAGKSQSGCPYMVRGDPLCFPRVSWQLRLCTPLLSNVILLNASFITH